MDLNAPGAELSVIGSMLLDPSIIGEVLRDVDAEAIGHKGLNEVFRAIRALWMSGAAIDPVTVAGTLPKSSEALIVRAMQVTPTARNFREYCRIVNDASTLRKLQALALRVIDAQSAEEARQVLASVDKITLRPKIRKVTYGEGLSNFLDRQQSEEKFKYLDWGFPNMNRHIQCPEHGKFVIIGADSSMGKTALALQFAYGFAMKGLRVGFFSLETEEQTGFDRIAAQSAKVRFPAIKLKALNDWEIQKVAEEGAEHGSICFDFLEASGCTVDDIRACTLADRYDVIFIDYVQLISAEGGERKEIVTNISMQLHTMAQSLGVTVVGLSQITVEKGAALSKESLRESKQLKNDADIIILIDKGEGPQSRKLVIDKNKEGSLGFINCWFDPEHMRFEVDHPENRRKKKKLPPSEQIQFEESDVKKEELPF